MKNRVIYSFLVASLTALMMLACTDDIIVDGEDGKTNPVYAEGWGTCFSSGISEDSRAADGPRKISVNYDMKYFWTYGDYIWVKDGSTFLKSDSSSIQENTLEHDAHFYFRKKLEDEKYEIRYTGNGGVNGRRADSVHIAAIQVQTKPGSEHVGKYGDCGVDSAKKNAKGHYTFNLKHKASFLLLSPSMGGAIKGMVLRSIKVTKLNCTPGDSAICGSYGFDYGGLRTSGVKNAGKSITLNLFTTDANGNEQYYFPVNNRKKTDSCLYIVLQPGNHELRIDYDIVVKKGNIQVARHNKNTNKYEYSYTDTASWTISRKLKATAHTFTANGFTRVSHKLDSLFLFEIPYAYYQWGADSWVGNPSVADYGWNGNRIHLTNSDPADAANYEGIGMPLSYRGPGENWYTMSSLTTYHPVLWVPGSKETSKYIAVDETVVHSGTYPNGRRPSSLYTAPTTSGYYGPTPSPMNPNYVGPWYWTRYYTTSPAFNGDFRPDTPNYTYNPDDFSYRRNNYIVGNYGYRRAYYWYYKIKAANTEYQQTITADGFCDVENGYHYTFRSIDLMPSANEMTYYLKYGDIHRDTTILWRLAGRDDDWIWCRGYRGDTTLCRGGIWIKKMKYIKQEHGPVFDREKCAYQINGADLDLRSYSPARDNMFRCYNEGSQIPPEDIDPGTTANVKYGMPADTSKYFFLPLMGYIHNVANAPETTSNMNGRRWSDNKGQYKFVGAEGYYWTCTMWPKNYFPGEEGKVPATADYNLHGERESYYLHITPYYVTLSWAKRANRIHGFVGNRRPPSRWWQPDDYSSSGGWWNWGEDERPWFQ